MKKLFTFFVALFVTSTSFAQVANPGFETWRTKTGIGLTGPYSYDLPQNWEPGIVSELLLNFGMMPNITKATTARSGSFAMKLSSSADTIGADAMATFALPANTRPDALTGFFQTSGTVTDPGDYGQAYVFLTKWNGIKRDTIGFGAAVLDSSPNGFSPFSAPVTYTSNVTPDTAIAFMFYFPEEGNTHMLLDDLAFLYLLGTSKETPALAQFNLYPNPVSENATITFNAAASEKGNLIIRDLTGREVKNVPLGLLKAGANNLPINTSDLKPGMYTATLQTAKNTQTLRFVKR